MILDKAIREGLTGRNDVQFNLMFNFLYADGHKMLSLGGMIASDEDTRKLQSLDANRLPFLRRDLNKDPYEISVPMVTRKELLYLASEMPRKGTWTPTDFELDEKEIEAFSKIYKYYPGYTEMLL